MVGRSVRTTKCCSSFWSSGVKQLMSVPTARRTARPDVGAPSGTFALTTILMPRCSSSRISSARSPAPHASIAASSALLGSGPTSNGGAAAVASIRDDGPFDGTSPPMVTLKLTRSMRAFVGSKDTSGAARTCKRSKWTSMIRRATTLCTRGRHEFRSKTQSFREFLRNGASRENAWRCELRDHSLSQSVMSRSPRAHHIPSQRTAPLPSVNTSTKIEVLALSPIVSPGHSFAAKEVVLSQRTG